MSMICTIYAPSEAELRDLLEHPKQIHDLTSVTNKTTRSIGLEKSWHGLHYLLTGSAWEGEEPLSFLVMGGEPVGEIDLGYGPARAFGPEEVRNLAEALSAIDAAELRRRFRPAEMMREEIYPCIWDRDPREDDTLGELLGYFDDLKAFIQEAADQGRGLVVTLG